MITFIKKEIVFITGSVLMLGILVGVPALRQMTDSNRNTIYQREEPIVSAPTVAPSKVAQPSVPSLGAKAKTTVAPKTHPIYEEREERNDD